MADKDLESRLKSHSRAFEGLLSLIPADLYYEKDRSDQWEKKKQTPEERRLAKKAKLNPANHRTAKDVMDENERKRRREEGEEVEDEQLSELDALGKEKPLEGLKHKQPKTKVQKTKAEDDVHSKDEDEEDKAPDPKAQNQIPKMSTDEKRREKERKRKEKRAKKEEKEKAKQARKAASTKANDSKTEAKSTDVLTTIEDPNEEEDALQMDNDMEAVDVAGLVPNEEAGASSDSSAADSTFSHTSNKIPSSNSSMIVPTTNGPAKPDTNEILSNDPPNRSSPAPKAGKPSAADKEALLARLRAKMEAHRKARNADGLNGQPAKNRHELIEARRLKAEKRKAIKKELRQADREQAKKAEMEAHLAELRGSPSVGSDIFGSRAGSMSPPQNTFSFGRVAFTDGETANSDLSKLVITGKKKANSDPKAALQAAEKKQARLKSLDENKRADIEQKDLWLNAKKKVHGEKVRDDTSLLKKTLKRKEQEKAKSAKEWNERKEGISKSQEMKQKKREANLQARKEGKGAKGKGSNGGKKSGPPKKKRRPGFEATLATRQRKRRYPERQLLERLHGYEELLRQNNIPFQALNQDSTEGGVPAHANGRDGSGNESSPSIESPSKPRDVRNVWESIEEGDDVAQVVRPTEINSAWDRFHANDTLLFGTSGIAVDLSDVHPMPVHILKLWQVYLENVNPLLKVTHTPTLQPRIIEAAGNFTDIDPALETLMFSIYCMAIQSLPEDNCMAMFGSSKQHLLPRYQDGCQQALLNCGFLRRNDRDSLTALYLYLMSVMPNTVPQSLSSILGIAIRTAQRMGIHNESTLFKHSILEAEMRRRLWWALVAFDTRVGEMAGYSTATLGSQWTCKVPLNVNDSDLHAEMKEPPDAQTRFTEATFAVIRGEIGDFVRHAAFHLDYATSRFSMGNPTCRETRHDGVQDSLSKLEENIDAKYLKSCDPENPLHFMTTWMTRAILARHRLMELLSKCPTGHFGATDPQRLTRLTYALEMIQCDTKIATSPLTRGFCWMAEQHFPFFAYVIIVQILMRSPRMKEADEVWEALSDHYEARLAPEWSSHHSFFLLFSKVISRAWKARELAFEKAGSVSVVPRLVAAIARRMADLRGESDSKQSNNQLGRSVDDLYMPMQMPFIKDHDWTQSGGGGAGHDSTELDLCFGLPGQAMDLDANSFELGAMDWDALLGNGTSSLGPAPPYMV
ncbi:hypothetical protein FKW77_003273 [Venturia effusa]|uniref:Xylanolytic transcriptional activator regulatory domain-containing protein n=1 Tax=Venturia effusa TaxID=50376 RepID=A0A517LQX7_9PEZI|nr:hypothetical protein FKW77_003273 [Venturia effusa]